MSNKFVSILSKAGQVASKFVVGVDLFSPFIKTYTPDSVDRAIDRAGDLARESVEVIKQAEIMGQALGIGGADKLKAAAPAMAQVILRSSAMAGKQIQDPELFQRGVTKIADGWADVLNSVHGDELVTT